MNEKLTIIISGNDYEKISLTLTSIRRLQQKKEIKVILVSDLKQEMQYTISDECKDVNIQIKELKKFDYQIKDSWKSRPNWLKNHMGKMPYKKQPWYKECTDTLIYSGFLQGIVIAKGKYLMCMQQGWELSEDFWENSVSLMEKNKVTCFFSPLYGAESPEHIARERFIKDDEMHMWDAYRGNICFHRLNGYGNCLLIVKNRRIKKNSLVDTYTVRPIELTDKFTYNLLKETEKRSTGMIQQNKAICLMNETNNSFSDLGDMYDKCILYLAFLQERIWEYRVYKYKNKYLMKMLEESYIEALHQYANGFMSLSNGIRATDAETAERFYHLYLAFKGDCHDI